MSHITTWDWEKSKNREIPLNNVLFQYIEKRHAEIMMGRGMDDEEWFRFLRRFQDTFAELASELANECLITWESDLEDAE